MIFRQQIIILFYCYILFALLAIFSISFKLVNYFTELSKPPKTLEDAANRGFEIVA